MFQKSHSLIKTVGFYQAMPYQKTSEKSTFVCNENKRIYFGFTNAVLDQEMKNPNGCNRQGLDRSTYQPKEVNL